MNLFAKSIFVPFPHDETDFSQHWTSTFWAGNHAGSKQKSSSDNLATVTPFSPFVSVLYQMRDKAADEQILENILIVYLDFYVRQDSK